jgi:GNAT superfamily N-acetyltransferase
MSGTETAVVEADLSDGAHAEAVVGLLNEYARDRMGIGRDLPDEVQARIADGLRSHPTSLVFLAMRDERAVGVAVCFVGYSTFAARPLINVHDLSVEPAHRGAGVGRALLEAVERKAVELGCCKLTLEVLSRNDNAKHLYGSLGFAPGEFDAEFGTMQFWQKNL